MLEFPDRITVLAVHPAAATAADIARLAADLMTARCALVAIQSTPLHAERLAGEAMEMLDRSESEIRAAVQRAVEACR